MHPVFVSQREKYLSILRKSENSSRSRKCTCCVVTTSNCAEECSTIPFYVAASLQYFLPIMFMGKYFIKQPINFPMIFPLLTTHPPPLHARKLHLPPTGKHKTRKHKDQNVRWTQKFALGRPWIPRCCPWSHLDSLESSTEDQCHILMNRAAKI